MITGMFKEKVEQLIHNHPNLQKIFIFDILIAFSTPAVYNILLSIVRLKAYNTALQC